jgi:hypothetical protein
MSNAFAPIVRARPCPIFGRPVHPGFPPVDYSPILLLKPFGFQITPDTLSSSEISRWPARHYPRLWIQRPSSERRRDFNPPDSCAAQRTLRPLLTSALRSDRLTALSVAEATQDRSPGVSSVAFRARSPGLRFASLMDMDFAVSGPLVRRPRLVPGSCPSTRTFALRFLQTSPRGNGPCVIANPSPPSGWVEDFHLQATGHAQHTTKAFLQGPSESCRAHH